MATLSMKASAVVVQGVTTWINQGELEAGHLLPSERTLAKEFKVSRKAVRRAIMLLAENGVLRNHPSGARTITAPVDPNAGANSGSSAGSAKTFVQHSMAIVATDVRAPHSHRGFNRAVAAGVAAGVQEAGFHSIVIHPNHVERGVSDQSVAELLASRPAGMLLPEASGSELQRQVLLQCVSLGIPAVIYGGSPEFASFDRVTSDHEAGTYELTRWVIAQGKKRIMQIAPGGATPYWFPGRRAGFVRAIQEAGLELLPVKDIPNSGLFGTLTQQEEFTRLIPFVAGHLATDLLGPNPVDALLGVSDTPAHSLIGACEFLGKKTHEEVMVVGYDNYWAEAPEYRWLPHSVAATVDKGNIDIGMEMVQLMIDRIEGKLPDEPQTRLMVPRLIIPD